MFRTAEGAIVWVLVIASGAVLAQAPAPPQAPGFRSGVEIVIVEATVLDRAGNVATGLTTADFQVQIGGRTREVVSADLVEYQAAANAGPAGPAPDVTTNTGLTSSRTILIVADQGSLGTTSRGVTEAARRWLGTLGPADRVGLVALPPPGPRVEFTTDHRRVDAALGKIAPAGDFAAAPFAERNVGLWEALRISDGDLITRGLVVTRECPEQDLFCPGEVDTTAHDMAANARSRTEPTLASIKGVLHAMRVLPGPKHVVLLSAGWPIDPQTATSELEPLAAAAAHSNITVHAFIAERWDMDVSVRRFSPSLAQDRHMVVSSVETLAGWTGGHSARVTGTGDAAFVALSGMLAGYYRLGVRPGPEDMNGRTRRISVKVSRPGLSIRAHRRVIAGSAEPADLSASNPDIALSAAIGSPAPMTGLALRATSYILHEEPSAPDHLRVLIAGDVTGGTAGGATMRLALFDEDGVLVTGADGQLKIPTGRPASMSTALSAPPGVYTLRIAVRDDTGRVGSLERQVDMRWRKAGAIETTGITLFHVGTAPGSTPEPLIDTVRRDERLIAQIAFASPDAGSAPPTPVIEITREGSSAPLLSQRARLSRVGTGSRQLAQEMLSVGLLPPGRYKVTAIVAPGVPPLMRSIEVVPEAAMPAESAAVGVSAPTTPAATPARLATLTLARPAHFDTSTVLDPARVAPILTRLAGRVGHIEVGDALNRMTNGPWPTDVSKGPLASAPLAAHFVAGLGRLEAGDLEAAGNEFRSALRAAPDFIPAMAYLAACYAAGGKNREAASAWQAALVRERDAAWLHRLAIEAWLRAERPAAALALTRQARQRFPADDSFVRLQAAAELADGRAREGLETVASINHPDETLLLMALATLYTAAAGNTPVWDVERDLAAMKRWREAYAGANGGALTLVDSWLAEMASLRR